jgi:hypothetical protein
MIFTSRRALLDGSGRLLIVETGVHPGSKERRVDGREGPRIEVDLDVQDGRRGATGDNDNFEGCSISHGVVENCMNESRVVNGGERTYKLSVPKLHNIIESGWVGGVEKIVPLRHGGTTR